MKKNGENYLLQNKFTTTGANKFQFVESPGNFVEIYFIKKIYKNDIVFTVTYKHSFSPQLIMVKPQSTDND